MNRNCRRKTEKVYVKVTSDFDATGYMQPRQITWGLCLVLMIKSNSSPIVINVNDSPLSDVTLTYSSSIRLS